MFAVLLSAALPQSLCWRGPETWEVKQGQEPASPVSLQFLLPCSSQMVRKKPHLSFINRLASPVAWLLTADPVVQVMEFCYTVYSSNNLSHFGCWWHTPLIVTSISLTWFHQLSSYLTSFISAGNSDKFKYSVIRRLSDLVGLPLDCLHFTFPGHFPHFSLPPAL